jgi:DNA-directed RNA polymerase specialized sigma24 family protein
MPLEAFQRVAERHTADVWRFCASQVGVQLADECYQETMLAAMRAYPGLRDADAVRPWLLRIASRKAIDMYRERARAPVPVPEIEPGASAAPPSAGACSVLELLRGLPEKQRVALAYRFLADLAYREIGRLMGTSEEAARRNVHEGIKTLRTRLGDDAEAVHTLAQ